MAPSSQRRFVLLVLLAITLCSADLSAGKKRSQIVYRKPDQREEITGAIEKASTALKPCMSYVWAAAVETLVRPQHVSIKQEDWVVKAFGGAKCIDRGLDYTALAARVSSDYALDDGRKVRISAAYEIGLPDSPEALVMQLRQGRQSIMVWKGKPFLLIGVLYDLAYDSNYRQTVYIRELKLVDLMATSGTPERIVVFKRDLEQDNSGEINGFITIDVRDRAFYELDKK